MKFNIKSAVTIGLNEVPKQELKIILKSKLLVMMGYCYRMNLFQINIRIKKYFLQFFVNGTKFLFR